MPVFREEQLRKIAAFMRSQPEVELLRLERGDTLHIRYSDGIVEHWSYNLYQNIHRFYRIPTKSQYPLNTEWPEFRCQFSRTPGDPQYSKKGKFFLYTHRYLSQFMFCNTRVFLHRLAKSLSDEGYVNLWLSDEYVKKKLSELESLDWSRINVGDKTYKEMPQFVRIARDLLLLIDIEHIADSWDNTKIFCAIDRLHRRKRPITRSNIVWQIRRVKQAKFSLGYPIALSAILRHRFKRRPIINKSGHRWVDVAIMLVNENNPTGESVYITTKKLSLSNPQIILGQGDYKIINSRPDNTDFMRLSILT